MSNKFDENKSVSDDTIEINEILLDITEDKKTKNKRIRRNVEKSILLVIELFVIFVSAFALFLLVTPNSKAMLLNSWIGRTFIKLVVTDSEYNNILDKDYNRNDMNANDGVDTEVLDKYTNIALFGLDSRYGELENGVRSDTIIVLVLIMKQKRLKCVLCIGITGLEW